MYLTSDPVKVLDKRTNIWIKWYKRSTQNILILNKQSNNWEAFQYWDFNEKQTFKFFLKLSDKQKLSRVRKPLLFVYVFYMLCIQEIVAPDLSLSKSTRFRNSRVIILTWIISWLPTEFRYFITLTNLNPQHIFFAIFDDVHQKLNANELIIYIKKLLDSDWSREVQLLCNSVQKCVIVILCNYNLKANMPLKMQKSLWQRWRHELSMHTSTVTS